MSRLIYFFLLFFSVLSETEEAPKSSEIHSFHEEFNHETRLFLSLRSSIIPGNLQLLVPSHSPFFLRLFSRVHYPFFFDFSLISNVVLTLDVIGL